VGQNIDWDFPLARGVGDPIVLACGALLCVLLAAVTMLLLRCRTRDDGTGAAGRIAAFGVFWFFLLLAPTSSVIPVVDVLMEHRVYLASWGIFLASAVLASTALQGLSWPSRSRVALAASLVLCVALAAATYLRVGEWKSKLALWTDAVAKSPRKARVHLDLGHAYREHGETQRAVEEYRAGLALAGHEPRWIRTEIRGKLAAALLSLGRPEEAIADVQQGLTEDPHDGGLLGVLALAHLRRNELPLAAAAAEQSVRSARDPAASLRVLGLVRTAMGEADKAIAAFESAVQLEPDDEQGRLLLAQAYRAQGRMREACAVIHQVSIPSTELKDQIDEAAKGCRAQ
jgi:Flp pilus assembly protein TadD